MKPGLPLACDLSDLLDYDPDTGLFAWKKRDSCFAKGWATSAEQETRRWNSRHAGKRAFTCISPKGYMVGALLGIGVRASNVAWAISHGEWPDCYVDHINTVRSDDRLLNLRLGTPGQNARNRQAHNGSVSGLKGVSPWGRKWKASIVNNGVPIYLGLHPTKEDAARAYDDAALREHGAFARTNQQLGLLKKEPA